MGKVQAQHNFPQFRLYKLWRWIGNLTCRSSFWGLWSPVDVKHAMYVAWRRTTGTKGGHSGASVCPTVPRKPCTYVHIIYTNMADRRLPFIIWNFWMVFWKWKTGKLTFLKQICLVVDVYIPSPPVCIMGVCSYYKWQYTANVYSIYHLKLEFKQTSNVYFLCSLVTSVSLNHVTLLLPPRATILVLAWDPCSDS